MLPGLLEFMKLRRLYKQTAHDQRQFTAFSGSHRIKCLIDPKIFARVKTDRKNIGHAVVTLNGAVQPKGKRLGLDTKSAIMNMRINPRTGEI